MLEAIENASILLLTGFFYFREDERWTNYCFSKSLFRASFNQYEWFFHKFKFSLRMTSSIWNASYISKIFFFLSINQSMSLKFWRLDTFAVVFSFFFASCFEAKNKFRMNVMSNEKDKLLMEIEF